MCEVALSDGARSRKYRLEFDFKGSGALKVDGKVVSIKILNRSTSAAIAGRLMDDQDYEVPFKVTGTIDKLTLSFRDSSTRDSNS